MWTWIRSWLERLGVLSPWAPPGLTAAQVMSDLRAKQSRPADETAWQSASRRFHTKVYSDADRQRLWRRYRRKYSGELHSWGESWQPSSEDQACLDQILLDLAR